jgi:hypothetical protein
MECGIDHDLYVLDASNNTNDETKNKCESSTWKNDGGVSDASISKLFFAIIRLI